MNCVENRIDMSLVSDGPPKKVVNSGTFPLNYWSVPPMVTSGTSTGAGRASPQL